MDRQRDAVTLYTVQSDAVMAAIRRDGQCFSRADYVQRKYGESSPVFLTAYQWFAARAERLVPRPEGAGLPYWAFADRQCADRSGGGRLLTLRVPVCEAVFFDMYDWTRILQLGYLCKDPKEAQAFSRELKLRGLRESDVVLSRFYPELRQRILDSWDGLFLHHERILAGDLSGVGAVQAALWRIRGEWITAQD